MHIVVLHCTSNCQYDWETQPYVSFSCNLKHVLLSASALTELWIIHFSCLRQHQKNYSVILENARKQHMFCQTRCLVPVIGVLLYSYNSHVECNSCTFRKCVSAFCIRVVIGCTMQSVSCRLTSIMPANCIRIRYCLGNKKYAVCFISNKYKTFDKLQSQIHSVL